MRLRIAPLVTVSLVSALLLSACATDRVEREPDETGAEPMLASANVPHQVIREAFLTALTPPENVDSPASWIAPDGRVLLLATSKKTSRLMIYDGDTGAELRRYGSAGAKPGQFLRPNGIAVHGDRVYVVERDNRRVQVLQLPGLESLGSFGTGELQQPYGLWVRDIDGGKVEVLVSDAYMAGEDANGDEIPPPLAQLNARFKGYEVGAGAGPFMARYFGAFGDTSTAGAIRVPESLWGDVANDRLLIAEEDLKTGTAVREYDLAGKYRGRTIGLGLFKAQAEGIALWTCADGSGYWLTTDQFKDRSLFHVFDRKTLAHLGAFSGETVGNTDGVWLQQGATKRFPAGVFYAVHDDMGVGAFDWRDIAKALSLRENCGS
ncbi:MULTISPECIES: phytase [unclassified Lysobacter]|uniref:phytase n=1 Tax=unclassified Lysobacter TaxID=2635362 RepID=UPI0006FA03E7|nr:MULTISPECIES: phytase [unclassified Lysobacter]KQZ56774.1 phytase [Lysobacter sp. Root559]KRC34615.1 phytase [Lysobacter sp. Root76]KRD70304.1 phytase [Lysobacter sp. Root96]